MTADTRVREIIEHHRKCVSFPSCCLNGAHVRLSDDERAVLRALLTGTEPRARSFLRETFGSLSRQPSAVTRAQPRRQPTAQPRQSAQPRQPTAEQWKSVRQVLERVRDAGRKFPQITIVWDGDATLDRDVNGSATVRADGACVITLRCSQSPDELRRTFSHELGHAWDAELLVPGRGRLEHHVAESRASDFAGLYGW